MMDLFRNPSSLKASRFETAMWATRLVLMSMGFISTLILIRVSIIPYIFNFIVSTFPRLWISARSWLSPAFVYVIVNFIIVTIAAFSYFHHKNTPVSDSAPTDSNHTATFTAAVITELAVLDTTALHHQSEPENQRNEPKEEEKEIEELAEVKDSSLSFKKPLPDPSPEKCNDYISPDSDDTLEATWKAIMEGQGKIKAPQLKKSDTWSATNRITRAKPFHDTDDGGDDHVAWAKKEMKKSGTFNDRVSLRREKSMSPEELYRRAEAFIQKFNNQMKLQRLESYQRFMEVINRGVKRD